MYMKYATYHIYIINVYFCIVFMHIVVGEFSTFVLSEEQWPFILVFSRIYYYGLVKMMISLFKTCIFFSLFTYIFFSYVHSGFYHVIEVYSIEKTFKKYLKHLNAKSPEYARNKYFSNMFLFGDVLLSSIEFLFFQELLYFVGYPILHYLWWWPIVDMINA